MPSKAVLFEQLHAQKDAKKGIDEYGAEVIFYLRPESGISRDKYKSLQQIHKSLDVAIRMNCYPIHDNPTTKQLEKAGLTEKADTMITTSYYDWETVNGINMDDIDTVRMTAVLLGITYKVKEKSHKYQIGHKMLYISFGLAVE